MDQSISEDNRAPSLSRGSSGNEGDGGSFFDAAELDGPRPLTSGSSKMVVLAGERKDLVEIGSIIERFRNGVVVPSEVTVLERESTYYGPKLLVHAQPDDVDRNYLITAPGPGSELMLWGAETDGENNRTGWYRLAEVKAQLAENQPSYEVCPQCKNAIQSIEHERMAALGMCGQETE